MQKSYMQKSNIQKQVDGLQLLLQDLTERIKLVEDIIIQVDEEMESISSCSDEEFTLEREPTEIFKKQKTSKNEKKETK
jgi:hypothetical protein